jgi:hypothetical protein
LPIIEKEWETNLVGTHHLHSIHIFDLEIKPIELLRQPLPRIGEVGVGPLVDIPRSTISFRTIARIRTGLVWRQRVVKLHEQVRSQLLNVKQDGLRRHPRW